MERKREKGLFSFFFSSKKIEWGEKAKDRGKARNLAIYFLMETLCALSWSACTIYFKNNRKKKSFWSMCRAREDMQSLATAVPCQCWTGEGQPLLWDQEELCGPEMDACCVPGPCMAWCLLLTVCWELRGWAAPGVFCLHPCKLSHCRSVSRAVCSHLANGPLNPTWQMTFSIFILLSSAPS